ncbi:hypothetical protein OHD16_06850 [Sphingobacterium sp. ML3W]|uniref:hypothetical protein n=1 Tax=Sphingobacterium sp. ML3W TaxID=1538644 RepID=UPI00249AD57F|nr:hypothetical protein [Sphingobacterium sp. ML3W]WFA79688.1 hypothetical protein OGI71_27090 [Sphingobacterium sp. ML3W]
MEFKGTKGNWRMCISDYGDLVSDVKHLDPSKLVCQIYKHKSIEGRANSLLISKAPEMLDMLRHVLALAQCGNIVEAYKVEQLIESATTI